MLVDEAPRGVADHERVGLSRRLHAGGDVGRVALREVLLARDRIPRRRRRRGRCGRPRAPSASPPLRGPSGLAGPNSSMPLRMSRPHRTARGASSSWAMGEPEVDQDAVTQILRDMPIVPLDRIGADALVVREQVAEIFGIERLGERGRVREVAHDDRELATLPGARRLRRGRQGACRIRRRSARLTSWRTRTLNRSPRAPRRQIATDRRAFQAATSSARMARARATRSPGAATSALGAAGVVCCSEASRVALLRRRPSREWLAGVGDRRALSAGAPLRRRGD